MTLRSWGCLQSVCVHCTVSDSCQAGTCTAGAALNCNDNNGCTSDACNPASGCVNFFACDDGDVCTKDLCDPVLGCQHLPTVNCNDNLNCTLDTCDKVTGCAHKANTYVFNNAQRIPGYDPATFPPAIP